MEPEVPIALRMSGHLLLGVVRIYSKKVDYLFQDCNAVLTGLSKAFASIQINLPEDARQAPFQSITLPETFDLDSLNIDFLDYGVEDVHMRNQEEITLTDQVPVGMDYYVAITFDEDIMDSSHMEVPSDSGARPMEEDNVPQSPLTNAGAFQDHGPSTHGESPSALQNDANQSPNIEDHDVTSDLGHQEAGPSNQTDVFNLSPRANSPQVVPEIEVLRDANNDANLVNSPPVFPDQGDNNTETNELFDQIMNDKDHSLPIIDDLDVGGLSVPSQQHSGLPTPSTSQRAPEAQVSVGHDSPNLVLRSSPPIQQPQRRGRKRKQQFFDTSTVLTNKVMKKALNDPANILRKRRFMPSSDLLTWKMNNSRRKEQVFDQSLLTGLCKDLLDISKREYICTKPHLIISEEDQADEEVARTPTTSQIPEEPRAASPPVTACDYDMETHDMEIERLRSIAATPLPTIPDVETEVTNIEGNRSSPARQDDMPSVSAQKLRSVSVSPLRTNDVAGTIQTPDLGASPGDHVSNMETPMMSHDEGAFQENFGLSDTHHLMNSADEPFSVGSSVNDMYILIAAAGSQGSEGVNSLSVRTRAVAQYLKNHSPISTIEEEPAEDLSLNKILEGKTKKISARMFFETLVLKSYGLIDVQQEEPYGDISLKLTPELSKAQL
ncbi:sister chromatid cohesion 1 protein 3-like [Senna tora]|uniref:Sister chromatid cohesion 1 protein 3-like n=1 Tax=Senna tora TaxID=362788 RepID=A0A835CC55_9FABA|nr:sister chromatid cohesion 1 protein 3-like [Senna tora]